MDIPFLGVSMLEETVKTVNLVTQYIDIIDEVTLKKDVYDAFIKEFPYEYADPVRQDWITLNGLIIRRGLE